MPPWAVLCCAVVLCLASTCVRPALCVCGMAACFTAFAGLQAWGVGGGLVGRSSECRPPLSTASAGWLQHHPHADMRRKFHKQVRSGFHLSQH